MFKVSPWSRGSCTQRGCRIWLSAASWYLLNSVFQPLSNQSFWKWLNSFTIYRAKFQLTWVCACFWAGSWSHRAKWPNRAPSQASHCSRQWSVPSWQPLAVHSLPADWILGMPSITQWEEFVEGWLLYLVLSHVLILHHRLVGQKRRGPDLWGFAITRR